MRRGVCDRPPSRPRTRPIPPPSPCSPGSPRGSPGCPPHFPSLPLPPHYPHLICRPPTHPEPPTASSPPHRTACPAPPPPLTPPYSLTPSPNRRSSQSSRPRAPTSCTPTTTDGFTRPSNLGTGLRAGCMVMLPSSRRAPTSRRSLIGACRRRAPAASTRPRRVARGTFRMRTDRQGRGR